MVVVVIGISSRVCIEKTATFRNFEKLLQAQVLGLKYIHQAHVHLASGLFCEALIWSGASLPGSRPGR